MSRRVNDGMGQPVAVETDEEGHPLLVEGLPVLQISSHHRQWVGILEGEPQVDVWKIKTARRICELHFVCYPVGDEDTRPGTWLLVRWED